MATTHPSYFIYRTRARFTGQLVPLLHPEPLFLVHNRQTEISEGRGRAGQHGVSRHQYVHLCGWRKAKHGGKRARTFSDLGSVASGRPRHRKQYLTNRATYGNHGKNPLPRTIAPQRTSVSATESSLTGRIGTFVGSVPAPTHQRHTTYFSTHLPGSNVVQQHLPRLPLQASGQQLHPQVPLAVRPLDALRHRP